MTNTQKKPTPPPPTGSIQYRPAHHSRRMSVMSMAIKLAITGAVVAAGHTQHRRIGEAAHPGPLLPTPTNTPNGPTHAQHTKRRARAQHTPTGREHPNSLVLRSINTTHSKKYHSELYGSDVDVLAVQETKLTKLGAAIVEPLYNNNNWNITFAQPVETSKAQTRRYKDKHSGITRTIRLNVPGHYGRSGGMLLLTKKPMIMVPIRPINKEEQYQLMETGRFMIKWIPTPDKYDGLYVATIYGYSGASVQPHLWKKNECLLRMILKLASRLGNAPIILMGDFNIDPQQSSVLEAATNTQLWVDVGKEMAMHGMEQKTFSRDSHNFDNMTSRIDIIFANQTAWHKMEKFKTYRGYTCPNHIAVECHIRMCKPLIHNQILTPCIIPDLDKIPMNQTDMDRAGQNAWEQHKHDIDQHMHDPEQRWKT